MGVAATLVRLVLVVLPNYSPVRTLSNFFHCSLPFSPRLNLAVGSHKGSGERGKSEVTIVARVQCHYSQT